MPKHSTVAAAFVGLDLGTTNVKALAIDAAGGYLCHTTASYPTARPRPGWAEQQPDDWWAAACIALRALLADPKMDSLRVTGLGLSGQMHGATVLDVAGLPLRPSLLWSDDRGATELGALASAIAPREMLALTGSLPNTSATLTKLLWLRAHEPALFDCIAHVLLAKDELRRRLTGDYVTDPTDAAGTLLFDLRRGAWSASLLRAAGLDEAILPRVVASSAIAGHVTPEAAGSTGLPVGLPVVGGSGDAASAAFGVDLRQLPGARQLDDVGDMLISIGTAAQITVRAGVPIVDEEGRVQTLPATWPNNWQVMAAMLAGGAALEWLALALEDPPPEAASADAIVRRVAALIHAAESVTPGAQRLLFLPYLSGERSPHLDPRARGAFVGLTLSHSRAHLARAVVEGVAFALRDGLDVLRSLGLSPARALFTGGPAGHQLWRQVLADVLAMPIATGLTPHGSALGAARLALSAVSGPPDTLSARATASDSCAAELILTYPDPHTIGLYDAAYAAFRPLYAALWPTFQSFATWPSS